MWSWQSVAALVDSHPSPDAAHLLGERVVVEHLRETHYAVDAGLDVRRVTRTDGSLPKDVMTLRVRSAHHYSAGVECWIARPKLNLTCGVDAGPDVAWRECTAWLRKQGNGIAARSPALGKHIARSHAAPATDPSSMLRALADTADAPPPHVTIRRRSLRAAVPSETQCTYEQSDLEAGGRLWRAICCESTTPSSVRNAAAPLRDTYASGSHLSFPQFVQMILRTSPPPPTLPPPPPRAPPPASKLAASDGHDAKDDDEVVPSDEASRESALQSIAADAYRVAPPAVAAGRWPKQPAALGAGAPPEGTLTERLLDAWYASADVFSQRTWRAAQTHPSTFPPTMPPRLPSDVDAAVDAEGLPKAPLLATSEAAYRAAGVAAFAVKAADASALGADKAAALFPAAVPPSPAVLEAAATLEVGAAYGLLALFPAHVVRRAIGEAASAGDTLQLHQLLIGSRGAHLNVGCGMPIGTRRTPLQCASATGHASCVQLLLRQRAEVLATSEGGRTALHLAAMGGSPSHAACVRLLLRYGADASQPDLKGSSPIDLAPPGSESAEALIASVGGVLSHRFWVRGQSMPPVVPELLAAREREAASKGLSISTPPGSGATFVRRGVADLPGGPLRYRLTPRGGRPDESWVGDLVHTAERDVSANEGAWWSMQHPLDVH